LERWRWLGEGPRFLKIGGRVVYRLEDIERYEAEQLRDSTTAAPPSSPALGPGSMLGLRGMEDPTGEYRDHKALRAASRPGLSSRRNREHDKHMETR
jgi:hypothetical protein